MYRFKKARKLLCFVVALLLAVACLTGCQNSADTDKAGADDKLTWQDYATSKVGVSTGSYPAQLFPKLFPDAEISEFNSVSDMILALSQGKIDICAYDASVYTSMRWEGMNIDRLEEPLEASDYGMIFQKGVNGDLRGQFNAFIANIRENGIYDELHEKWFGDAEPDQFEDYTTLSGESGTLTVAVSPDIKPFSYMKKDRLVGYDIDVLTLFAREYGYDLDLTPVSFQGILMGVSQGKYDIGTSGITITEERAESVDFSDPYHQEDIIFMITGSGDHSRDRSSFRESFEKTFIRENRWKLIAEGIVNTLLISLFAVLGGTALGFGLYLLARAKNRAVSKAAKAFAAVYGRLIAGTPTLVVLMILFYVFFGKSDVSGLIVAILGFAVTFGAFVYSALDLSVSSVDPGQTEAAYALGYTRNGAFFRVVLPQALALFLPNFTAEVVGLIKATAVVGYIAVNDLTKMGDIIRSNTYEAFFPLIAVAVIYFMITWGAAALLGLVQKKADFQRRRADKILKGVAR